MDELDELLFEPPEIGTVLYMPGLPGGGSTIYDLSPYGNNGTILGAVWERTEGGLWSLNYDGVDDVTTIAYVAGQGLNVTTAVSVLFWYRPEGDASAANANVFGRANFRIYQPTAATPTGLNTYVNTSAGGSFVSGGTLTLNKWHQLCLVFDKDLAAKEHMAYLDGVAATPANNDGTLLVPTDPWYIGGGVAGQVNGSFALCRIYFAPLDISQIVNLYNKERHYFGV